MDNPGDLMHLCRLCLVKDQVNIPIFEEHGDIRQIFVKISSCLPVKVSKDDQLPKRICDGCSNKLDLLYEFCNTSANSEKKLLSWLEQAGLKDVDTISAVAQHTAKPLETQTQVKQEALEDIHAAVQQTDHLELTDEGVGAAVFEENAIDESDEPPPPKRARRTAAVKAQINITPDSDDDDDMDISEPMTKVEDESDDSDVDKDPSYVDVPGTSADDQPGPSGVGKDGVEAPCVVYVREPTISIKQEIEEPPNDDYGQKQCDYDSPNGFDNSTIGTELKSEIEIRDIKIEPITIQDLPVENSSTVPSKIMQEIEYVIKIEDSDDGDDGPDENIQCDICNQTYKTGVAFVLHSIQHDDDYKYSCYLCDFKTVSSFLAEMHVRSHDGATKYKCQVCKKAFLVSSHAVEHKYFHTGEKPFRCNSCGENFMFSRQLYAHKQMEHGETSSSSSVIKHHCIICDKNYISSSGLTRHNLEYHSGPYEDQAYSVMCNICGLELPSKAILKVHQRRHTTCDICSKSFVNTQQMAAHWAKCNKGLTQKSAISIHEENSPKTDDKPYKCLTCQKGFFVKRHAISHMKTCTNLTY